MKVYPIERFIVLNAEVVPRSGDLGVHEVDRYNGWSRRIGGDKGDLRFNGYGVVDGETVLRDPVFCTVFDDLTEQEVFDYAHQVLHEAFASIGTECVQ